MKTIWKFTLNESELTPIPMPQEATVVHVAEQDGAPTIWCLVDTEAPVVKRDIRITGTGHDATVEATLGEYVGAAFCGPFVWHVWDMGEV